MLALLTVFNSWVFLETRSLVQVFPEHVRKLWNNWELRVLVLVSLTLQLCLLHFGSLRRYSVQNWLRVFLWLSYLGADSVATVALGVISNNNGNCNDSELQKGLMAFWAPFLLLHLGGQDTITAYAVQDTELWLRHLLGLVVQSGVALYIILVSWKGSWLSFLTIAMFLAGFIKYAERTWVLKSANCDALATRIWGTELYRSDYDADPVSLLRAHILVSCDSPRVLSGRGRACPLFIIFRRLFLNQTVSMYGRLGGDYSKFGNSVDAWKEIEDDLGYAYDVYYTKAPLFFTAWGFLIRFFSFASILVVFVLFLIKERHKHPQIDLIITFLLLAGAILIEIYAVILLCASDWPWPSLDDGWLIGCIRTLFAPIRNRCAKLTSKQRWSNLMGQFDLLGLCLNDKSFGKTPSRHRNLFDKLRSWFYGEIQEVEMLLYMSHKRVSDELKSFVFDTFLEKLRCNSNGFSEEYNNIVNRTVMVETYKRIIIWHIATDLCFYKDCGTEEDDLHLKVISKDISDYMMYILANCPFVLSAGKGNAKLGVQEACVALKRKIRRSPLGRITKESVREMLMADETMFPGRPLDNGKFLCEVGLLPLAVPLAVQLAIQLGHRRGKWTILSKFWVETLAHVATLCQGNNHAQLLRKGGEFLTHVWLLVEYFGLADSFHISRIRPEEGEARPEEARPQDEEARPEEARPQEEIQEEEARPDKG